MNECEKIEKLIWRFSELTADEREDLSAHIDKCPKCREDLAGVKAIFEIRDKDREVISSINPAAFDDAVMAKIKSRKRAFESRKENKRVILSAVFSTGLAAAIVLFMIMSISDLGNLPALKTAPMEEGAGSFEKVEIHFTYDDRLEAPRQAAGMPREDKSSIAPFSILQKPVTSPAPDSVNIGEVYLSDEAVPLTSQQSRASISEVVIDTGMIQAVRIPEAVLVTVEKMPRPLRMVAPEYPVWGRKRGLSSVVWVKARIDENGNVIEARVVSSSTSGAGFEDSAVEAALKSRYIPAEANGIRIPVWIMYPVKYIYNK